MENQLNFMSNQAIDELTFNADDNAHAPSSYISFPSNVISWHKQIQEMLFLKFKPRYNSMIVELTFNASDKQDTAGPPISLDTREVKHTFEKKDQISNSNLCPTKWLMN